MTYCVGIKLDAGLVFLSDSRTNAGMDNIGKFCKMTVFEHSAHSTYRTETAEYVRIVRQFLEEAESKEPM